MKEKFKRIEKRYVLSDSSVNVYGYRLLTEGYQAEQFRRNPIGYYMHRRDEGIALKWDDLQIDGDTITGIPVINLAHPRGEQICAEAENGFLNAASVGHIVVLEHSDDAALQLPGQTGPTITRWYNKECSLVDIPGNGNALTSLYDAQENELNLISNGGRNTLVNGTDVFTVLRTSLQLGTDTPAAEINTAVLALLDRNTALSAENTNLQLQISELTTAQTRNEIASILDRALEDRRITVELRNQLATDYAGNATALKKLVAAMPAYRSVTQTLAVKNENGHQSWLWDDYEKNDPSGKLLKELRAGNPERYDQIFRIKFNTEGVH